TRLSASHSPTQPITAYPPPLRILRPSPPCRQRKAAGRSMPSILVIEETAMLRDLFRRVLEPAGYEVRETGDGAGGVQAYQHGPTDLVLCALFLPSQNGLGFLQELLLDPAAKVVVVSAGGLRPDSNDLAAAREMGTVATLSCFRRKSG